MTNIDVTPGTGKTVATETISGVEYQKIKLFGAETGSTSTLGVNPDRSINVSVIGTIRASVSGTAGASVIGTVPVTQAGAWSASITGGPISLLAPNASFVSGVTSVLTQTSSQSVLAAAGTGIKNYVTHIIATNAAATGTFVDIKDGGGAILYSGFAAASGGGFSSHIFPPIVGSANKSVDAAPRVQASVIVAMTGYTA